MFDINHFDREISSNTNILLNNNDVVHMAKGEHDTDKSIKKFTIQNTAK